MSRLLTRAETDRALEHLRERAHLIGLCLLVKADLYGHPDAVWAPVEHVSPGTASTFPIKVDLGAYGLGRAQYTPTEIIAARLTTAATIDPDWEAILP